MPKNSGIYEAINGDFLDSYNLSLLNPYMVGHSLFSGLVIHLDTFGNLKSFQNLSAAAQLKFVMVVPKSNVSEATVKYPTRFY